MMNLRRFALLACLTAVLVGCGGIDLTPPPDPNTPTAPTGETLPRYRARIATELAAGYFQRGQHAIALEELNAAIRADSNYGMAHSVTGLIHHELKDDAKAEAALRRAVSLDRDNPDTRNNLGWFLCRSKREKEGLSEFEAALASPLYQTPVFALSNAAQCANRIGLVRAAEGFYTRLLQFEPNSQPAFFGLADIAFRTSRFEEARAHLRGAMANGTPSAQLLYMGVCVERRLGDRSAEASYLAQMKNRFAEAAETQRAERGLCD